jgi:hypothetical protein
MRTIRRGADLYRHQPAQDHPGGVIERETRLSSLYRARRWVSVGSPTGSSWKSTTICVKCWDMPAKSWSTRVRVCCIPLSGRVRVVGADLYEQIRHAGRGDGGNALATCKDGTILPVLINGSSLNPDSRTKARRSPCMDLSTHRKAALARSEDATVRTWLGSCIHEPRNRAERTERYPRRNRATSRDPQWQAHPRVFCSRKHPSMIALLTASR